VKYIIEFTEPIYSMLRVIDTDKPSLHLIYEMWDSMIKKVKSIIFMREGLDPLHTSPFFNTIDDILQQRYKN
jgi:hypothetical protein